MKKFVAGIMSLSLIFSCAVTPLEALGANGNTVISVAADTSSSNVSLKIDYEAYYKEAFEVLALVNKERAANGLSALTMDKDLLDCAMQRAAEITFYYNHIRPDGTDCFTACNKMHAENIAAGQSSPENVMSAWLKSAGHKANILNSGFKSIGIGCVKVNGCMYWVQNFGSTAANPSASSSGYPSTKTKTAAINSSLSNFDPYIYGAAAIKLGSTSRLKYACQNTKWDQSTFVNPSSVTYSTSDPNVLTVSSDGTVKGVSAGTATVTAYINGDVSTAVTKKITVTAEDAINTAKVTLKGAYTYTGEWIFPDMEVKVGDTVLKNFNDYSVRYYNSIDAGSAWAVITGIGNYSGEKKVDYKIAPKSVSELSPTLSKTSYTYDGKAKTPDVSITYNGMTLVKGVDYTVSYSNNTAVGTGKVTIVGKGNYSGTVTKTFKIVSAGVSVSNCSVSLSSTKYTYDGNAKKPTVKVTNGKTVLKNGTDYTVAYSANKNVGTATVTVKGKGNYTGSKKVTFVINPAKQTIQKLSARTAGFYADWAQKGSATGYEIQYSVNSNFSGAKTKKLTANKPDTCTISGLSAGKKYYVRVRSYTVSGGKTYYGAWSDSKSVTTQKYTLSASNVSGVTTKAYTGKAITQSVTVKYNGKVLKNGTDYTVSYSNNKSIGKATVKITGKGSYAGTVTKAFNINPAKQTIQKLTAKSKAFYADWVKKGSATGYELQYATNSAFSGAKTVTVTKNTADTKTVSKLSGNKKYWVRVRSYTTVKNVKYYGAWSDVKTVTSF